MQTIEVRIQAVNTFPNQGTHDESRSYLLDVSVPINTDVIMSQLKMLNALKIYINEYSIPANPNETARVLSTLNEKGEFTISLSSTITGNQPFIVRIIE